MQILYCVPAENSTYYSCVEVKNNLDEVKLHRELLDRVAKQAAEHLCNNFGKDWMMEETRMVSLFTTTNGTPFSELKTILGSYEVGVQCVLDNGELTVVDFSTRQVA